MKYVGGVSSKKVANCNESNRAIARVVTELIRIWTRFTARFQRTPIKIVERYTHYKPPVNAVVLCQKALRVVPSHYLRGIDRIVLTNSTALPRRRRRAALRSRKRKVASASVLGLYWPRPARHGEIEIFVDRIVGRIKRPLCLLRREIALLAIGRVLLHEIGHHIDFTKRPAFGERETTAERYESQYVAKLTKRRLVFLFCGSVLAFSRMLGWMVAHPIESWYRIQFAWFLYTLHQRQQGQLEAHAKA